MSETRRDFMKFVAGGVASIGLLAVPRISEAKMAEIFRLDALNRGVPPVTQNSSSFGAAPGWIQDHITAAGILSEVVVQVVPGKSYWVQFEVRCIDERTQEVWCWADLVDPDDAKRRGFMDTMGKISVNAMRRAKKKYRCKFPRVPWRVRRAAQRRLKEAA